MMVSDTVPESRFFSLAERQRKGAYRIGREK
jgi:hypothetical protein